MANSHCYIDLRTRSQPIEQQRAEDVCDLLDAEDAAGIEPPIGPIAHAKKAEGDNLFVKIVPERAILLPLLDNAAHKGLVRVALRVNCVPARAGQSMAFAEEDHNVGSVIADKFEEIADHSP